MSKLTPRVTGTQKGSRVSLGPECCFLFLFFLSRCQTILKVDFENKVSLQDGEGCGAGGGGRWRVEGGGLAWHVDKSIKRVTIKKETRVTERERERERKKDRQTDRQTDRQSVCVMMTGTENLINAMHKY